MKHKSIFFFLSVIGTCALGILGLLVASFFGATAFLDFTAFDLRGYEAAGILGLYIGLVAGIILTGVLYKRSFGAGKRPVMILIFVIIGILIVLLAPIRGNGNSFVRTCRFDESSGRYTKCFWSWDKALNDPSVYF